MVVRGLVRRVVRGVVRRVVRGVGSVGSPQSGGQFFQLSLPLLLEIFRWENPKSLVPFTFQPDFPENFCKW